MVNKGHFQLILEIFKKGGDHEWHMIDTTMIRAHQHAAGARSGQENQALGKSRGGFSTKIHLKVDALGMPLDFILIAGQEHKMKQARALLNNEYSDYLIADRAYDAARLRMELAERGTVAVIPGKKNRLVKIEHDVFIYKETNCIERFFNRIKHFRRVATRYDKTAAMFMGALLIVSILIWLK